jgi:hypothetical protein
MKNHGGAHSIFAVLQLAFAIWHLQSTLNETMPNEVVLDTVYGLYRANDFPFIFVHFRGVFLYFLINPCPSSNIVNRKVLGDKLECIPNINIQYILKTTTSEDKIMI